VLPAGLPRVAVEMGASDGWWKYGCAAVVGIDTYGESAPAPVLFKHFGFTPENVADTVQSVLRLMMLSALADAGRALHRGVCCVEVRLGPFFRKSI
jgi:hypothetical protein